jgi:hypothetical protein
MKRFTNYSVQVLATGFVVLTLVSILLFWIRFLCSVSLSERMPDEIKSIVFEPSGLLPDNFEKDPNIQRCSRALATMRSEPLLPLGITEYFESISPGGRRSSVLFANSEKDWAYFDNKSGQFVFRYIETEIMPDNGKLEREVQFYIGPEGISEIPDKTLGRFIEPIVDRIKLGSSLLKSGEFILYDKKLRRFFKIGLKPKTFVKGPELDTDDSHEPVQIGQLDKNQLLLELAWSSPEFKLSKVYPDSTASWSPRNHPLTAVPSSETGQFLLILDKTGRIDLLDKETLKFAAAAGRLPETAALFGSEGPSTPKNTLSYAAKTIYLGATRTLESVRDQQFSDEEPLRYAGLIAASLSRDGTALALTVFDEKGQINGRTYRASSRRSNTVTTAYFSSPWAPALSIVKYIAESLHPPVLSIASCLTASSFEAGAGHRALLLLPNSFIAMKARDGRSRMPFRAMFALLLMTPATLLALWLAARILRDASTLGLSKNVRRFWVIAALTFGLTGYITYRLTRPKVSLVTCVNCGKPRRTDTGICHRCGSKWDVPELTPPAWRVLNG